MSIFDLVLTGFDEIGLKMRNKSDLIDEIANFDHLTLGTKKMADF